MFVSPAGCKGLWLSAAALFYLLILLIVNLLINLLINTFLVLLITVLGHLLISPFITKRSLYIPNTYIIGSAQTCEHPPFHPSIHPSIHPSLHHLSSVLSSVKPANSRSSLFSHCPISRHECSLKSFNHKDYWRIFHYTWKMWYKVFWHLTLELFVSNKT